MDKELNGYDLSRSFFDWGYENPDKISPNHVALYFFIIEHCNRLGWKDKFGLPTQMSMDAIGIKNWRTYKKAFDDLVEFGLIKVVQQSRNQYSATVIAIVKNTKANTKALSKATQKHSQKQSSSTADIDKPITKEPKTKNKVFIPPTIEEMQNYFFENGYTKESGEKAWRYYNESNWHDSKGNKVKNWKQKSLAVWFKPENKIKATHQTQIKY